MAKKLISPFIADAQVLERMRFENPWWISGGIDEDDDALPRRMYFERFMLLATETEVRRAVVLMGPRRVGKTVMLHHAIAHLLQSGINRQQVCYLNVENPLYLNISLEQMFALARRASGQTDPRGWFVFFDEIQYLRNWEVHLKVLVDSYPHTKFVVSGSAAAALRLQSQESGAGRFTSFLLPPLTFHEYIHLKGLTHLVRPSTLTLNGSVRAFFSATDIRAFNQHFIDYLNFGGYPEVIFSDKIRSNPGRYIKHDIVDKVLLRDLPGLYGIQDVQELNAFFTMLAWHSGQEVSPSTLSKSSGVEKSLINKYLTYLDAAFLIRVVHRVDDNARKFQRMVGFKVYLTNPSLRSAIFSLLNDGDDAMGSMVETAIFSQWMHQDSFIPWYARWGDGEVDMVGLNPKTLRPQWAAEIKWTNRFVEKPGELKSLLQFCQRNQLPGALVTTRDAEGQKEKEGISFTFAPSALLAYAIGANSVAGEELQSLL